MSLVITGFAFPAGAQVPTLETIANWQDTGVTVDVFTPSGWSAADPTVVFSHGDGASPIQYHCYREIWAEHGIRTISPYEANGTDTAGRQARWTEVSSVHRALSQLQDARHIFFAGHSFGAYATLLAAGADSRVVSGQAGNCLGDECPALPAQGYVILSGQPAQNAVNLQPYWFGPSAFDRLAPRRYVAYGTADYSPLDACMASGTPACRGDSYTIDSTRGRSPRVGAPCAGWIHPCSCSAAARTGGRRIPHPPPSGLSVMTSLDGSRRCRRARPSLRRRAASHSGTIMLIRSTPNAGR